MSQPINFHDARSTNVLGMPSPAGYRTALRLFQLAERFGLPVVTLVDTCGAWPSFEVSPKHNTQEQFKARRCLLRGC